MKKVVVISASPRKAGNSDLLCDEFINGAKQAGHVAEKIFLSDYSISYCLGCMACQHSGECVQKDDMKEILQKAVEADVIVLATPVYFYNMNAQMKNFIDRTVPRYQALSNKEFYIIMSAAEQTKEDMHYVMESFQGFFACLDNPKLKDVIYALGVNQAGEVKGNAIMKEAFRLGNTI